MKGGLIATVSVLIITTANAETAAPHRETAGELIYRYSKGSVDERLSLAQRISDIEQGMAWANAILVVNRGQPAIYCPPKTLVLTGDQVIEIIRQEITDNPDEATQLVGAVMITALHNTFPCPAKSP